MYSVANLAKEPVSGYVYTISPSALIIKNTNIPAIIYEINTDGPVHFHPSFGYITASSSIFNWIVVGMSEVIAVGTYMKFWWPDLPIWIPGLIAVISYNH